jgi:SAM-dependent methyltransferase
MSFDGWYEELEKRHLQVLTFSEVRRALQALSSLYVERRSEAGVGRALDSAGKRAAFALFYAPLHLLQTAHVARNLGFEANGDILDLGCGTGTAGIGLALETNPRNRLIGVDENSWALEEARWNLGRFGLQGRTRRADLIHFPFPSRGSVLLAFTVNELSDASREALLRRLLSPSARKVAVLVLEPIARRMVPWWDRWAEVFQAAGGSSAQWRWRPELPGRLRLLDKAAGLNHRELTCRSLWRPGER